MNILAQIIIAIGIAWFLYFIGKGICSRLERRKP